MKTLPASLLAKISWRLLPFLLLMYIMAFLDRANVGFAKQAFQADTGLSDAASRATRWDGVADYLNTAHEQLCLIVQVESRLGVENVAAIAAVEGVDAVFIGPADLSIGLGHAGNPGHPEVQERIRHAVDATLAAGKACGILAP